MFLEVNFLPIDQWHYAYHLHRNNPSPQLEQVHFKSLANNVLQQIETV